MKNKNIAGILGLFLGSLGAHRFYLGQGGMGILYLILTLIGATVLGAPTAALLGLVDAIIFFSMDKEKFDQKYNKSAAQRKEQERRGRRERRAPGRDRWQEPERRYRNDRYENRDRRRVVTPDPVPKPKRHRAQKDNPYRKKGIEAFKDYDYDLAIEMFTKALEINEQDVPVHFNLACSHSLMENKDLALYHLDRAVRYGFKDFDRIQSHDALAYLRVQPEFAKFKANGYQQIARAQPAAPSEERLELEHSDQIQKRLQQLEKLKAKGLLTEEQFVLQKERLLRS